VSAPVKAAAGVEPHDDTERIEAISEARAQALAEDPFDDDAEATMPNALILVTAHGRTDPGLKRKHNEDALLLLEAHHLFLIADGMGRHAAGEVASQLAVDAVGSAFVTGDFGDFPRDAKLTERGGRLKRAIQVANRRVFDEAHSVDAYAGMGTTVVSAYFSLNRKRAYVAHVGDSRCYRLRDGKLEQLTTDHTLEAAGIKGPTGGYLSRAVGIEENVEVDVRTEAVRANDTYLLCSDGLSRMASDDEIADLMRSELNLQVAVQRLIDLANARGGKDNVTVILVRAEEPTWKS
jgi:protein phosphatase